MWRGTSPGAQSHSMNSRAWERKELCVTLSWSSPAGFATRGRGEHPGSGWPSMLQRARWGHLWWGHFTPCQNNPWPSRALGVCFALGVIISQSLGAEEESTSERCSFNSLFFHHPNLGWEKGSILMGIKTKARLAMRAVSLSTCWSAWLYWMDDMDSFFMKG